MSEHSKLLSPSASGLWTICTAMPQAVLNANFVREDSAASLDGTYKHDLSESMYLGNIDQGDKPSDMDVNDWDEVLKAVDAANKFFQDLPEDIEVGTEAKVGFKGWRRDCFGTADLTAFDQRAGVLYVGDYKFGRVRVEAENNTQMLVYALAYLETTFTLQELDRILPAIKEVRLGIIQPKISRDPLVWKLTGAELREWDKTVLQPAQSKIVKGIGEFVSGPHCGTKYCKLQKAGACPKALEAVEDLVGELIDLDTGATKMETKSSNLDRLLRIMKHDDLIRKTLDVAFALATDEAKAGNKVEGYKLVKGKGRRKWADEDKAKKFLKGKLKKAEQFTEKFLTAPQAETKLKQAGKLDITRSKNLFEEQIEWTEGKPILVPDTDSREEIVMNQQEEIEDFFGLDGGGTEAADDLDLDNLLGETEDSETDDLFNELF